MQDQELSLDIWDRKFRYIQDVKRLPKYKRGIMRQVQRRDPYINDALRYFNEDLRQSLKGKTRAPGGLDSLVDSLSAYDKPSKRTLPADVRPAYLRAVQETMDEFKLAKKVTPTFVLDVNIIKSTSSGYPHFERKGDILDTIRGESRTLFHLMKRLPRSRIPYPYVAPAAKGGLKEEATPKTRLVWMYPAAMLAVEGVYAQPLIEGIYKEKEHLLLTGETQTNRILGFLSQIEDERAGIGLDFTAYDNLPFVDVIEDAFKVLDQNIAHGYYWDPENGTMKGGSGVEARSRHAYANIVDYFINTPMILPNGRVIRKNHGIPSGSHFTNLIGSIVNRILLKTFLYYEGYYFKNLMTNGDDSAFHVHRGTSKVIVERAASFFRKAFGMIVNRDKSCVAHTPAEMSISGTIWPRALQQRETKEWFELAYYPKAYVRTPFESFQRLLGLGIAGGFRNATFTAFFMHYQTGYDLHSGPNLLDWTKLRWLEYAFGIRDLPLVYKTGKTVTKIQSILFASK